MMISLHRVVLAVLLVGNVVLFAGVDPVTKLVTAVLVCVLMVDLRSVPAVPKPFRVAAWLFLGLAAVQLAPLPEVLRRVVQPGFADFMASGWSPLSLAPWSSVQVAASMVVVAGVFLFPLAFSGHLFSLELSQALNNAMGNGHWQSAVYALWDSIFAVGMCLGLITLFRRFFNGQGRFGRFLSQHGYAVYVIHIPLVVFLAYALGGIELAPLLKFGMAAVIMVPTCFAVAFIVRKIPRVSRIL